MMFDSDYHTADMVTDQMVFDSYFDAGIFVSAELVNRLVIAKSMPRLDEIKEVFSIDPPTVNSLRGGHVDELRALAMKLSEVFAQIRGEDIDAAATTLNGLLSKFPAHPHLAKENGRWRLHHHPDNVALVPMWGSICAEGLARLVGTGNQDRLGTCGATNCQHVFIDESKNLSRRYCSTACQNRTKAAAFRNRRQRKLAANKEEQ